MVASVVCRVTGSPATVTFAVVELGEQVGEVFSNDVDNADFQGARFSDRHALPHRLLGPIGIFLSLVGDGTGKGGEVVFRLGAHVALDVRAFAGNGMRGADVGARRHGRNVPGDGDEGAGRRRPRAARRYVHHHRHVGVQDRLDDQTGRLHQAAGGIELKNDRAGVASLGLLDALDHVFNDDGIDDTFDDVNVDVGIGCRGRRTQEQGQTEKRDSKKKQARHATPEQ